MSDRPGNQESLIPKHGGYRKLKSFQIARLVYDVTVRFCDACIDRRSRTHDQMVQAARSGVQNIAEGSQASGTSKKFEIKLTNVARASLEELRLDYEDYLRQHELSEYEPNHPALMRFKALRCENLEQVRTWVQNELQAQDTHGRAGTGTDEEQKLAGSATAPELAANAALSLLNLCCYLLDKQLAAQAEAFEKEGGFTERMYRVRKNKR